MNELKAKIIETIEACEKYTSLQTNDYKRGCGDGKIEAYREILRWLKEKPITTME